MLKVIESFLIFVVTIFLCIAKVMVAIGKAISFVIDLLIACAFMGGLIWLFGYLQHPWLMIVMISMAFVFVCFIILLFWRPKRLGKLTKKYLS